MVVVAFVIFQPLGVFLLVLSLGGISIMGKENSARKVSQYAYL